MNAPLPPSTLLSVSIQQRIAAKNLDNISREYTFKPSSTPYVASIGCSDNGVKWLVIEVEDGRFGWPFRAAQHQIDKDTLRVFVNGVEQDSLEGLE